jgi:O-antigen/teichoic acid export membrane protein
LAFVALSEAVVNLVLSLILVRHYGILGVAIGTAVPVITANLAILLPAACRQVRIGLGEFLRAVATAPLVGATIAAVAGVLLRSAFPPQSIFGVIAEGAAIAAVYFAAVWLLGFDAAVRTRYSAYARHALFSAVTTVIALTRRTGASPATI